MQDLLSLGFTVQCADADGSSEKRVTVRIASTTDLVAWVRVERIGKDGVLKKSTTTETIHRNELSQIQTDALEKWIQEQLTD